MRKGKNTLASLLLAGSLFFGSCNAMVDPDVNDDPANRAPVITSSPVESGDTTNWYFYDVQAYDEDGDDLVYSFGNPLDLPGGLDIDELTGQIYWRPNTVAPGTYEVVVDVYDGEVATQQTYTLTAN